MISPLGTLIVKQWEVYVADGKTPDQLLPPLRHTGKSCVCMVSPEGCVKWVDHGEVDTYKGWDVYKPNCV